MQSLIHPAKGDSGTPLSQNAVSSLCLSDKTLLQLPAWLEKLLRAEECEICSFQCPRSKPSRLLTPSSEPGPAVSARAFQSCWFLKSSVKPWAAPRSVGEECNVRAGLFTAVSPPKTFWQGEEKSLGLFGSEGKFSCELNIEGVPCCRYVQTQLSKLWGFFSPPYALLRCSLSFGRHRCFFLQPLSFPCAKKGL